MSTIARKKPAHRLRSEAIQAKITPALKKRVDDYCDAKSLSPSELFRQALEFYFDNVN